MKALLKISGLVLVFAFSRCSAQIQEGDLVGTQWEYAFDAENKDYIKFFDNQKYESYSAEAMMTSIGVYFVQNDTLNLVGVKDIDNDPRFSPGHRRALIEGDKLRYVANEKIKEGKWIKSDYSPPEYYFFTKVK